MEIRCFYYYGNVRCSLYYNHAIINYRSPMTRTDKDIIRRIFDLVHDGDIYLHEANMLRQSLPFAKGRELLPPDIKYKVKKSGWKVFKRDRESLEYYLTTKFPEAWEVARSERRISLIDALKSKKEEVENMVILTPDPLDTYIGKIKACLWLMGCDDEYEEVTKLYKSFDLKSGITTLVFLNDVFNLEMKARKYKLV